MIFAFQNYKKNEKQKNFFCKKLVFRVILYIFLPFYQFFSTKKATFSSKVTFFAIYIYFSSNFSAFSALSSTAFFRYWTAWALTFFSP